MTSGLISTCEIFTDNELFHDDRFVETFIGRSSLDPEKTFH